MTAAQNAIGCFFEILTIGLIIVLMSPKIKIDKLFKIFIRKAEAFLEKLRNLDSPELSFF